MNKLYILCPGGVIIAVNPVNNTSNQQYTDLLKTKAEKGMLFETYEEAFKHKEYLDNINMEFEVFEEKAWRKKYKKRTELLNEK